MAEVKQISLYPSLTRFARTEEQYDMFEGLERCIEFTDTFLKSNRKVDFEKALDQLNYSLLEISTLSNNGQIEDQEMVDIIHDVLLLPSYILQYTIDKNETAKTIK